MLASGHGRRQRTAVPGDLGAAYGCRPGVGPPPRAPSHPALLPNRPPRRAPEQIASWDELEAYRRRVRGRFRDYLDSLSDSALTAPREMNIDGAMISHAPADILTLLLLHEREHHGDLNTLLYQIGVEPPQLSYRFFLYESRT